MEKELINYLSSFVTDNRKKLFEKIIKSRTNYLTVALEDIYQPQNASAVLRSVDCFGLQSVYVIENRNEFRVDTEVALGSSKWLNIESYNNGENNTREAINSLRDKGYRIVATTPHEGAVDLEDFDLEKGKAALFFGTELTGISDIVKDEADEFLKIPMFGFTESFNISVSAAIILHYLTYKLRKNSKIDWQLNDKEKDHILLNWLRSTIHNSDFIEKQFLSDHKK